MGPKTCSGLNKMVYYTNKRTQSNLDVLKVHVVVKVSSFVGNSVH